MVGGELCTLALKELMKLVILIRRWRARTTDTLYYSPIRQADELDGKLFRRVLHTSREHKSFVCLSFTSSTRVCGAFPFKHIGAILLAPAIRGY